MDKIIASHVVLRGKPLPQSLFWPKYQVPKGARRVSKSAEKNCAPFAPFGRLLLPSARA